MGCGEGASGRLMNAGGVEVERRGR
jgi:hypothetical protein